MLVIDGSRSMLADDVEPNRLAAARRAARAASSTACPTSCASGLVALLRRRRTRSTTPTVDHERDARDDRRHAGRRRHRHRRRPRRGAGHARRRARRRGRRPPGAIVLLSDGKTTVGRDPLDAARGGGAAGRSRSTRSRSAPRSATVTTPGGARPSPSRPTRRRCGGSRPTSGGRAFSVDDADELDTRLRAARLAARVEAREARDHGRLRGRRHHAPARRRGACGAARGPVALRPTYVSTA